jgi:hypothetical protein
MFSAMTTDPIQFITDAFDSILTFLFGAIGGIVSGPYNTWLTNMLGNVMQWLA